MEHQMIRILGTQRSPDGEENEIELVTEGKRYEKSGATYIVYDETTLSGMEGSTTTLKIEGTERVSMKRFGSAASLLVFERGKRHRGDYHTPYGQFRMEIKTNELKIDIAPTQRTGSIKIAYDMYIVGLAETSNVLTITLLM